MAVAAVDVVPGVDVMPNEVIGRHYSVAVATAGVATVAVMVAVHYT